ncbi:MAG: GDSL-type esterase/lipase family protein [Prevotella sp.]|jgi:lysophospholipase L1-like esterase|nr:GDSL-type esterase/lipase family protein [Prevotella sp.]
METKYHLAISCLFLLLSCMNVAADDGGALYRYNLLETSTYVANSGFDASTPINGLWDGSTSVGVNSSLAVSGEEAWIEFDFGSEEEIAEARLYQDHGGNRVTHWKVARWNGEEWIDIFTYATCGSAGWQTKTFETTASKIRFYAKCAVSGYYVSIHEIELYTKPSATRRKTLVGCVGDSNTAGSGASASSVYSWPAQLSGLLGTEYQVKNFGLGGTTLMTSADQPYINTTNYQNHKNYNANISIIALGTNDSKNKNWNASSPDNFRNDYISLIEEFQQYPSHPEVYMLMPIRAFTTADINNDNIVAYIRPIIREISKTYGIALIDGYATTENLQSLMPDKIHLNDSGLLILAKKVASILQTPKPVITIDGTPSAHAYAEYRWYRDGTFLAATTASNYTATQPGTYKVAVKFYRAATDDVIVSDTLVVSEANAKLVVSDEAASNMQTQDADRIKVSFSSGGLLVENAAGLTFSLFDISGKCMKTNILRNTRERIDTGGLAVGIYLYGAGTFKGKILIQNK